MLNKWISDSESSAPIQLRSKKDEEEQEKEQQNAAVKKSEG
jgi:hypothetical protein